jgi:hypothetical protein
MWNRIRTPRGLAVLAVLLVALVGIAAVAVAAPVETLLAAAGAAPIVGMALSADRETQMKEWPGEKAYPVLTGVTIHKGGLVCADPATGYACPGADTANYRILGVAMEQVAAGAAASGTYKVRVRTGMFLLKATSITQAMVGQTMYVKDDETFDDTSTNGVFAGILMEYVSATSGWLLVGPRPMIASSPEIDLADGKIFVGDAAGVAQPVTPSGDVTITNAGVTAIGAKKVLETMIAVANGKILVGGAGGAAAAQTMSGDATLDNTGALTIAADAVEASMILPWKGGGTTVAGDALAIPVTHSYVAKTTAADAEALTLANGTPGQFLTIALVVDGGGDGTLTPTTKTGFATIVFADAGDNVTLLYVDDTVGWVIVGAAGVAAPPVITI